MRFKRHIIGFALAACVAVSCAFTTGSTFAATVESSRNISWEDKIDSAIWQSAVDENGRYLVYVSRTGISDSKIEKEFNKRNEYPLSYYRDQATYRAKVGPEVAVEALHKYGLDESLSLEYGREIFDDNVAPIEYELLENYNEFVMNKRKVITDLYGEHNDTFAARVGIDDDAVLYEGMYTGSYVMYASQEEIERIAKDKSVTEVSVWENGEFSPMSNSVQSQIHTDSTTGTKSTNFNNGTGYKGTGIKIGIIEAGPTASFDTNSPQLRSIYGKTLFYMDLDGNITTPPNQSISHTNLVVSIIVGQKYVYGGETYEGVVPNATVYQTYSTNFVNLNTQIQNLANLGVTVINFSGGKDSQTYGSKEREIDKTVENAQVSLVCAAGNSGGMVGTPAMCYNVITVGNVYTKRENGTPINTEYSVYSASNYGELNNMPNKPDIVAPGMNISCIISNNEVLQDSGTSFAAPFVTGVIAQILQTDETLSEYRSRVRAILLAGADPNVVSTANNLPKYSESLLIRDKSGVGMVNAINSIEIAENFQHAGKLIWMDMDSTLGERDMTNINLTAGQTIRIVLCYNQIVRSIESDIEQDAELFLYRGSTLCASSETGCCNVQVIEYTATTTGTYTIASLAHYELTSYQKSNAITVAWRLTNNE